MNHQYQTNYANVFLRPLAHEDIQSLRQWRNDKNNTKFLSQIPHITEEMQEKWFSDYLKNEEMVFAIVETSKLNRMVGSLSLYNITPDETEFGKILIGDQEAHGMKVGVNATVAALKIAFECLRVQTVYLHVFEGNDKALHIYRDAGFKIVNSSRAENGMIENKMIINKSDLEAIEYV